MQLVESWVGVTSPGCQGRCEFGFRDVVVLSDLADAASFVNDHPESTVRRNGVEGKAEPERRGKQRLRCRDARHNSPTGLLVVVIEDEIERASG